MFNCGSIPHVYLKILDCGIPCDEGVRISYIVLWKDVTYVFWEDAMHGL